MCGTNGEGPPLRRPRIIVADDHSRIRQAIEEVLASSFDVVAAVANGREAVDAAHVLDPDVVVLDITMPVMDGFDAARELVRSGARAKIILLSVHAGDEYVTAAVEAGVEGYVHKARMTTDLNDAITHVLAGRLRLPTASALLDIPDQRARHTVQFHAKDDARFDELCRFAAHSLRRGIMTVAVGRRPMLDGVAARLTSARVDLTSLRDSGRYQEFDAAKHLSRAVLGDEPEERPVIEFLHRLERSHPAWAEGQPTNLVVFGEIASALLRDGNIPGALALERIWHAHSSRFHTLCSYCSTGRGSRGARQVLNEWYAAHSAVSA